MGVIFEHRLHLAGAATRALELDGQGPPLLLLHGFADSADTWRESLDRFRVLGRRALALDMPGFGKASRLRADEPVLAQLGDFARAAVERLADEAGEPVFIAGNSLGGCVALRAAEEPSLPIAGVVPVAPAGLDMAFWLQMIESAPLVRLALNSPLPLPPWLTRQVLGAAYRGMAFARPRAVPNRVVAAFAGHWESRHEMADMLGTGRRLRREIRDPFRLERIECPVLVIWGERDRMVYPSGAKRVLDAVPGARLELIADCGHCPQVEAPDRFVELVEEFCASAVAAAG